MTVYLDGVILLNFLVDYFLLLGADRICGYPPAWGRCALSAALGGVYAGACLFPQMYFLGNILWRTVALCLMGWIAYGASISAIRRCVIFVILSMALGGMALGIGTGGRWALLASVGMIFLMCAVGFRGRVGNRSYVRVELRYGEKRMTLTALQDTGNTLQDPITGRSVLVIGADAAQQLTGLTPQQLKSPVQVMVKPPIPGLRLIPYNSIDKAGGMLLALRFPQVKIGNWKGSSLVAFAPEGLCSDGTYQALTGGTL